MKKIINAVWNFIESGWSTIFITLFVIVLMYVFYFSCQAVLTDYHNLPQPEIEYQEIKSFSLHSETSFSGFGSFSLGCGYVYQNGSTEIKYYFYKKGQVGYILCSIDADKVEIVETDDKSPGIEGFFNESGNIKSNECYIIYVPVGTIYEEYKV